MTFGKIILIYIKYSIKFYYNFCGANN